MRWNFQMYQYYNIFEVGIIISSKYNFQLPGNSLYDHTVDSNGTKDFD